MHGTSKKIRVERWCEADKQILSAAKVFALNELMNNGTCQSMRLCEGVHLLFKVGVNIIAMHFFCSFISVSSTSVTAGLFCCSCSNRVVLLKPTLFPLFY